jgi:hypothetical protein
VEAKADLKVEEELRRVIAEDASEVVTPIRALSLK